MPESGKIDLNAASGQLIEALWAVAAKTPRESRSGEFQPISAHW
jgi:hypothetical protein